MKANIFDGVTVGWREDGGGERVGEGWGALRLWNGALYFFFWGCSGFWEITLNRTEADCECDWMWAMREIFLKMVLNRRRDPVGLSDLIVFIFPA